MTRLLIHTLILALALAGSGCASIAVTVAGVAGGLGVSHYTGSVNYRTFTEPQPQVRRAVLIAMHRMKAEVEAADPAETPDILRAKLTGRDVQIDFEALSATTTRIRTVARIEGGLTLDGATASEIVAQTEKVLADPRAFVPTSITRTVQTTQSTQTSTSIAPRNAPRAK